MQPLRRSTLRHTSHIIPKIWHLSLKATRSAGRHSLFFLINSGFGVTYFTFVVNSTMVIKPSVSFILNGTGRNPLGGLRIIYEYANRLADRGWKVRVIHAARLASFPPQTFFLKRLRLRFGYLRRLLFGLYLPTDWFKINPDVKMLWIPTLEEKYIPDADVIVACPVETALFVNSYGITKGKKYYFIQGFRRLGDFNRGS